MTGAPASLHPHEPWSAPSRPGFSSRRPLLLGFLTLAVLAAGLFGWGTFASISGAVIAAGRVAVETGDQVVEHIDGGTVGRILVSDGARVAAGDVLIRFEEAALRSEEAILQGERIELAARRNRLEAEFRGTETIAWDAGIAALAQSDATARDVLDGQQRLFEARRSSWGGRGRAAEGTDRPDAPADRGAGGAGGRGGSPALLHRPRSRRLPNAVRGGRDRDSPAAGVGARDGADRRPGG